MDIYVNPKGKSKETWLANNVNPTEYIKEVFDL